MKCDTTWCEYYKKENDNGCDRWREREYQYCDLHTPLTSNPDAVAKVPPAMTGFYSLLRELKDEVIEAVRSQELDDGDELCLDSQELIVGWIDRFFENKIYDIEHGQ